MKITVNNLAKIDKAEDIEIKDFNIFIGKNGTGKTYFAKLIYFLNNISYKIDIFKKVFHQKLKDSFNKKETIVFTIQEQIEFSDELNNYIKIQYAEFIGSKKEMFDKFTFDVTDYNYKEMEIEYMDTETLHLYHFRIILLYFFESLNLNVTHYLPAARANYMITYKNLFASQFSDLRDAYLTENKKNKVSILPEIENNFLKDIYEVDTKIRGELYSLGNKIEKNIFKSGKLSIRNPQSQDLPTYEYKLNDLKQSIDLVSASSAITELSPLIMYFRHKIRSCKKEMLIIDEPELSLHPEAQAALVEIMVEAVNKGLKIILVTHSPYIIEALNNHLQRDKISDFDLPKEIKEFEPISADKVGAYLFEDETIKNILDNEVGLIDDKLLNSFNKMNDIYDSMRDIEWENSSD